MDKQDAERISSHLRKLLDALRERGVLTNHQVRRIAGSRGMARANELQKKGYPITVRKLDRSTWEVRYNAPPLGRDAKQRIQQKSLF